MREGKVSEEESFIFNEYREDQPGENAVTKMLLSAFYTTGIFTRILH